MPNTTKRAMNLKQKELLNQYMTNTRLIPGILNYKDFTKCSQKAEIISLSKLVQNYNEKRDYLKRKSVADEEYLMKTMTDKVNESLKPLFEKAEKENLLFYNYHIDYLLPYELKEWHKKGSYIWGADYWRLVPVNEYLEELNQDVMDAEKKVYDFSIKLQKQKNINDK